MSDSNRRTEMTEQERRDLAFEQRGELTEEDAQPIAPRRLDQAVSLRLDPEVLSALRDLAESRGTTVSDLLREGAQRVLDAEAEAEAIRITHVSVRSGWESPTYDIRAFQTGIGRATEGRPVPASG